LLIIPHGANAIVQAILTQNAPPFQQGHQQLNGSHGYLQLDFSYDQMDQILHVRLISARGLHMREKGIAPNAFVKIYLLPGRK
jgi:hypothetical protein